MSKMDDATLNSIKCKLDYKDNKINIKVKFSYVINSIKNISFRYDK